MGVKNKSKQNVKQEQISKPVAQVKASSDATQLLITNIKQKTDIDELIKFIKIQSNAQFDEIEFAHGPYAVIKASKENVAKILNCDRKKFGNEDLHVAAIAKGSVYHGKPKFCPESIEPKKQVRVCGTFNADELLSMVTNSVRVLKSNNSLVFEMNTLEDAKNVFVKLFKLKGINRNKFKLYYQDPKAQSTTDTSLTRLMLYNAPMETTENDLKQLAPDAIQIVKNITSIGCYFLEFADNAQCKAALKVLQNTELKGRSLRCEYFNDDFTIRFNVKPSLRDPVKMKEYFPKATLVKAVPTNKGPTFQLHFVKKEDWLEAVETVKKGTVGNYHIWTVVTKRDSLDKKVTKPKTAVQIKGKNNKKNSDEEEDDDEEEVAKKPQKSNSNKRARAEEEDEDDVDSEDDDEISLEGESDDDEDEDDDDDDSEEDEDDDDEESEEDEEPSPTKKSSVKPTMGAKRNFNASNKNMKKMRRK